MANDWWQSIAFMPGSTSADWVGSNAGLGPDSTDPFGDKAAAAARRADQLYGLEQQGAIADQARGRIQGQINSGLGYIQQYGQQGANALNEYQRRATTDLGYGRFASQNAIEQGRGWAQNQLEAGYNQGRRDISGGYAQGRSDLASAYGQARGDLGRLQDLQAYGAKAASGIGAYDVTGAQDRTGRMLDQRGGLYGGFESDPGFRFRQQQGEDAINRSAAARGGRLSGRTLQELGEFNQGLASQEYGNFASRRQAEAGVASGSDAQRAALLQNQAGRSDQAALATQANQMGLAGIGYGAQGQLANLASQYGQGRSGMSVAGGQALGNMAYGYGGDKANITERAGGNLANMFQQSYGQQAGMQNQTGSSLADLWSRTGSQMGQTSIAGGALDASLSQQQMEGWGNFGGDSPEEANAANQKNIASIIASIFSDRRLKAEIEEIPGSKYEAIGLKGYRWKWNEQAGKLGLRGVAEGVIAQHVLEKYPHAVVKREGWLAVDYMALGRLVDKARRA